MPGGKEMLPSLPEVVPAGNLTLPRETLPSVFVFICGVAAFPGIFFSLGFSKVTIEPSGIFFTPVPFGSKTPSTTKVPSAFSLTIALASIVAVPSELTLALPGSFVEANGDWKSTAEPSESCFTAVPGGRGTPSTVTVPSGFSWITDPAAMLVDPSAFVTEFFGSFVFARGSAPDVLTMDIEPSEFLSTVTDGGSLFPSTL